MWKRNSRVRPAQRLFRILRRIAPRENKTQIAGAFRQRDQPLTLLGGDDHILDARHGRSALHALHGFVNPALRNRDHHHAGSWLRRRAGPTSCPGMPQDDVSSRRSPPANRRARAHNPPMGRAAASSIQAPSPVVSQLGMHRTMPQPQSLHRAGGSLDQRLLHRRRLARRSHINRLLEKTAPPKDRAYRKSPAAAKRRPSPGLLPRTRGLRCSSPPAETRLVPASPGFARMPPTNSAASLARITPRLAESPSGFSTQG